MLKKLKSSLRSDLKPISLARYGIAIVAVVATMGAALYVGYSRHVEARAAALAANYKAVEDSQEALLEVAFNGPAPYANGEPPDQAMLADLSAAAHAVSVSLMHVDVDSEEIKARSDAYSKTLSKLALRIKTYRHTPEDAKHLMDSMNDLAAAASEYSNAVENQISSYHKKVWAVF